MIDVMVLVEAYDPEEPYREPLGRPGYAFDHRDEAHVFFFCRRPGELRVHLHVVEPVESRAQELLAFRNHLRANPETAAAYEALKLELAPRFDDENGYAGAKTEFVHGIVSSAGAQDGATGDSRSAGTRSSGSSSSG